MYVCVHVSVNTFFRNYHRKLNMFNTKYVEQNKSLRSNMFFVTKGFKYIFPNQYTAMIVRQRSFDEQCSLLMKNCICERFVNRE